MLNILSSWYLFDDSGVRYPLPPLAIFYNNDYSRCKLAGILQKSNEISTLNTGSANKEQSIQICNLAYVVFDPRADYFGYWIATHNKKTTSNNIINHYRHDTDNNGVHQFYFLKQPSPGPREAIKIDWYLHELSLEVMECFHKNLFTRADNAKFCRMRITEVINDKRLQQFCINMDENEDDDIGTIYSDVTDNQTNTKTLLKASTRITLEMVAKCAHILVVYLPLTYISNPRLKNSILLTSIQELHSRQEKIKDHFSVDGKLPAVNKDFINNIPEAKSKIEIRPLKKKMKNDNNSFTSDITDLNTLHKLSRYERMCNRFQQVRNNENIKCKEDEFKMIYSNHSKEQIYSTPIAIIPAYKVAALKAATKPVNCDSNIYSGAKMMESAVSC
jgi:hypothetical protein